MTGRDGEGEDREGVRELGESFKRVKGGIDMEGRKHVLHETAMRETGEHERERERERERACDSIRERSEACHGVRPSIAGKNH